MRKFALISALLLGASPAAAQVTTSLTEGQLGGQGIQSATSQAPTTGVLCTEEMTATFCNVPSGPSEGGYRSGGVSTSSRSGTSSVSAPSGGASGLSGSVPHHARANRRSTNFATDQTALTAGNNPLNEQMCSVAGAFGLGASMRRLRSTGLRKWFRASATVSSPKAINSGQLPSRATRH